MCHLDCWPMADVGKLGKQSYELGPCGAELILLLETALVIGLSQKRSYNTYMMRMVEKGAPSWANDRNPVRLRVKRRQALRWVPCRDRPSRGDRQ
jgi:hypothetical protein